MEIEIPFGAKDSELKGWEYTIPEDMEAVIKDGKVIVKKKDSEDEKIRKELMCHIQGEIDTYDNMVSGDYDFRDKEDKKVHSMLKRAKAYLEKQKEQKPEVKYVYPKFRKGDIIEPITPNGSYTPVRVRCITDGSYICRSDDRAFLSLPLLREDEYKVVEQKPAEWSEEDADILNCCISSIEEAKENRYAYKETDGDTSYDREIDWLKSLCPQSHWKPSEEQMDALYRSVEYLANYGQNDDDLILNSLYYDLKREMEE